MVGLLAFLAASCATTPQTLVAANGSSWTVGRYYLSGDATIFPETISDNDEKTYITWPVRSELPAVFGLNQDGEETLVNGHFRGDAYVIDEIYEGLRFRLGKASATASRSVEEQP